MKKILLFICIVGCGNFVFSQVRALHFDGSNDQVIVSGTSKLNGPTQITLETWVYVKNFNTSPCADCAPIIWAQSGGYRFGTGNGKEVSLALKDGNSVVNLKSTATLTDNKWHHIAATYDSSMIRIYIDGSLTDSLASVFTISYGSTSSDVWIVDPVTGYGGILEETRIWNYARSQSEIRTGMSKKTASNAKGLILQLSYDEGVPYKDNTAITTTKDNSPNKNDGALTNFRLKDSTSNYVLGRSYCDTIAYSNFSVTRCGKYPLPSKKKIITKSGTYKDTIKSFLGCDSAMTIKVTINNSTASEVYVSACDSFKNPLTGVVYKKSGFNKVTRTNSVGCDSVITFNVIISVRDTTFFSYEGCSSVKINNGKTVYKSGTLIDTFYRKNKCDSFVVHRVIVNKITTSKKTLKMCKFVVCPTNSNKVFKKTGVYFDTITNQTNCDSIIEYTVLSASSNGTINTKACSSYKSPSLRYTYTQTGTYYDTLFGMNSEGCDSFIKIYLVLNVPIQERLTVKNCRSYTVPSGNQIITTSKTVKDFVKSKLGCDSIAYTIDVTIINANVGITREINTLIASTTNPSALFQWLDCDKNYGKIAAETSKKYTPIENGLFALEVKENNCTDTSNCIVFAVNGLNAYKNFNLMVSPNPSKGVFTINANITLHSVGVSIMNVKGQTIQTWELLELARQEFSVKLSPGLWYIKVESLEGQQIIPMVFE